MPPEQDPPHVTRAVSACADAVRVLVFKQVQGDTYAIIEGGEVSLSSGATLKLLIQQLPGRKQ